ncbi:MAG: hypothetical protein JSR26_03900 [Proteobacteria bacterium]|nr:hypothetical protein [Pseudomonadota bacterium]
MKVVLQTPHTHAGIAYPAGTAIEVDPPTAAWLAQHAVIAPLSRPRAVRNPEPESPSTEE